jgi:hypothetical protein
MTAGAVGGGGDRRDLDPRPLIPIEGEAAPRGAHRGHNVNLNIHNPQTGYVYYWCRNPRSDRSGAQLYRLANWGYEVVAPEAPEFKARAANLRYSALGIDSYATHGDVVLVRIPEDRYRAYSEWRRAAARAAFDGATESWLQSGEELASRAGYNRPDAPIYYRAPSHGYQTESA